MGGTAVEATGEMGRDLDFRKTVDIDLDRLLPRFRALSFGRGSIMFNRG